MKKNLLLFACLFFSLLNSQENSGFEHAQISIYAVKESTKEVLVDYNSSKSLNPASCMKLITTAAALHLIGPESRFQTHLEYDGEIDKKGVLHGNIYIRGGGDPCLGSGRIPPSLDEKEQIKIWTQAVQQLGIKVIEGAVIGDATGWEKAQAVPSWLWEDLGNYYGAGASALSFHENTYQLLFEPGKEIGSKAKLLRCEPPITSVQFYSEVRTGPEGSGDRACIYGSEFSPIQYVRGTIPLGIQEFSIKGAIPDPAVFCADLLSSSLQEKGIAVTQKSLPEKKRVVFHTTPSPSVKEIVYWTNQLSINLYAEHLFKKMGEIVFQEGSSLAGAKAVTQFLKSHNKDLSGFNIVDGSGLSRKNLVTAKQLVSLLLMMKKNDAFLQSLPIKNESCRFKTGSMSLVKCAAGYSGDVVFAILINNCLDTQMNEKIEQWIADLGEGRTLKIDVQ